MASSSAKTTPKSILKKKAPAPTPEDLAAARNRELAVHHALIIQHQKDVEAAILESIEALIEYPLRTQDPSQPDPEDVQAVKKHLSSFRPSDFDSAIEERNLDEKCGYMLCPRPRIKQNTTAKFRLLQKHSLQVVKTSDLEKWCSEDCAKRALYLRVQLKESPPWERVASAGGGLSLYGETRQRPQQNELDKITKDLHQLALERGDTMNSFRAKSTNIDLQEKFGDMVIDDPVPPSLPQSGDEMLIEGYSYGMSRARMEDPLDMDLIKDKGDILENI